LVLKLEELAATSSGRQVLVDGQCRIGTGRGTTVAAERLQLSVMVIAARSRDTLQADTSLFGHLQPGRKSVGVGVVAAELKAGTIERVLAMSDLEVGLATLLRRVREP
jgi:hypothetical protein